MTGSRGVGVVGAGIMGRRMMAALQQHAGFEVAALWDPHTAAAEQALPAGARLAPSLQALAQDPAVQLVYVASPPAAHLEGVLAAVAARKPVLCEKPLAHTVAQAQALRDAVAAAALPFAVNFPFARSPAALRLVDLVASGALGAVQQATVRLRFAQWPRPWQAGAADWLAGPAQGGFTREVLSHFVFLAQRLFGPAEVAGVVLERAPGGSETRLQARLVHAGVTLHVDAAVAGTVADDNRFEIVGSRDRAALVNWASLEHGGSTTPRVDSSGATLDALAALLDGDPAHGLATADEALAVVRIIEAMVGA